jgi:hypothetical protein
MKLKSASVSDGKFLFTKGFPSYFSAQQPATATISTQLETAAKAMVNASAKLNSKHPTATLALKDISDTRTAGHASATSTELWAIIVRQLTEW